MQRWLRGGGNDMLLLAAAALLFLAALLGPFAIALAQPLSQEEEALLNARESGQLIRLHVVAHSDEPWDQTVKLAVRDAVIAAFGKEIAGASAQSSDAAFACLRQNLKQIEQTAAECARSLGFEGKVRAEAGVLPLPAKQYGQVMLPAGEYRALRITLGDGRGQNWWCVLYPQLCLALAQEETQDGNGIHWDTQRILKQWLLVCP